MSDATLMPSLNSAGRSAAAASSTAIVPAVVSSAAGVPEAQPVSANTLAVASMAKPANLEILNCSPIGKVQIEPSSEPSQRPVIWGIFTCLKQALPLEVLVMGHWRHCHPLGKWPSQNTIDKGLGSLILWFIYDLTWRAIFNHDAVIHKHHSVGNLSSKPNLVGHDNHRHAT